MCFNYLRSLSLQIKSRPLSHQKCVIFFLQNHSNCRDVKMGGWASLFSGLSRRIPDSVTQRAVAAYFTGENYEFVGRESLYRVVYFTGTPLKVLSISRYYLK